MPWAALSHPPPPLLGSAQTQKLHLVRTHIGFKTKKKPRETGFPDAALGEERKAVSRKRDPTWEDRDRQAGTHCAPHLNRVKTGFCCCKTSSQVQTCPNPVGIHETTSSHPQVGRRTPNPDNLPPGYNHCPVGDPGPASQASVPSSHSSRRGGR